MQAAQTADVRPARRPRRHSDVVDEFVNTRCSLRDTCALRADDFVLLVIE